MAYSDPDINASAQDTTVAPPEPQPAKPRGKLAELRERGGLAGAIGGALLFIAKAAGPVLALLGKLKFLLVVLKFASLGKLLLTTGSMLLYAVVLSLRWGWPMAIGFVILIFLHEFGHVFAAKQLKLPVGNVVFIPFMGAAMTHGKAKSVEDDAYVAIMGPFAGGLASVACFIIGTYRQDSYWIALANLGALMNLFNMLPTLPLDGGWIAQLFSPKALVWGLLLVVPLGFFNPFIWLLGVMALPHVIAGWKADPTTMPYYKTTAGVRWAYAACYVTLAVALVLLMSHCSSLLHGAPHIPRSRTV